MSKGNEFIALRKRLADRMSGLAPEGAQAWRVQPDPQSRYAPFPLNDMQRAYVLGRNSGLEGNAAMQCYMAFATTDFSPHRFDDALNAVIERHDMLRAVVLPDGMQQVLENPPRVEVGVEDLSSLDQEARTVRLRAIEEEMWHHVSDLGTWPQSEFRFSRTGEQGAEGVGVLHCRLDMWCFDGRSLQVFFEDLARLYADPAAALPPLHLRFCDYMRAVREEEHSAAFERDLDYWRQRLKTLPPAPALPRASVTLVLDAGGGNRFTTRKHRFTPEVSARITEQCARQGVSPASFMASVYCEVIRLWSGQRRFTLNFPRFNRRLDWHPDVDAMIGEFATFTLLEADLRPDEDFLARTRRLQASMWENLEHDKVSGIRVLRERILETGQPEMQAMPVVFTAMPERRGPHDVVEKAFATFGELVAGKGSTPQVWLDSQYFLMNGELHVSWDAQDGMFPPGMVQDMFDEYTRLVALLADERHWHGQDVARLPHHQLAVRKAQNERPQTLPSGGVFRLFAQVATRSPQAIALAAEDITVPYGELYSLALRLGTLIVAQAQAPRGAESCETEAICVAEAPDESTAIVTPTLTPVLPVGTPPVAPPCVGILLERGWRQVAAVMGVAASGLAYLPLDPDTPPERLETILCAARPVLVITDRTLPPACLSDGCTCFAFDDLVGPWLGTDAAAQAAPLPLPAHGDPAYLMFTSGSTGVPKGVTIGQGALLNVVLHSNTRFGLSSDDVLFCLSALHHDLSVYDIFGGLAAGARLVIPSRDTAYAPESWLDMVRRHGVTFWNSVPVFMEQLLEQGERRGLTLPLRTVVLGGDWVSPSIPGRLRGVAPDAVLYTSGGPTETTLWNILNRVEGPLEGWTSLPYGRPIPNAAYHVLDDALHDAPDWVQGEMCCSGLTLCLGASLDPAENARAFVAHPETGERLYRTGDMGRYRPGGMLEILGRKDFQLNIGGYRLDPGEIEQVLATHPDVHRVVVGASATGSRVASVNGGGRDILSAFILPVAGADTAALEKGLAGLANRRLPSAMRPRRWVMLDEFPLTRNGKVDRKLLMRSASDLMEQPVAGRGPSNAVELFLAGVWADILRSPVKNVRESFFEMGGDSLKAMRVFAQLEAKLGLKLPLSQVFTTPTIEGLAHEVYARLAEKMPPYVAGGVSPTSTGDDREDCRCHLDAARPKVGQTAV